MLRHEIGNHTVEGLFSQLVWPLSKLLFHHIKTAPHFHSRSPLNACWHDLHDGQNNHPHQFGYHCNWYHHRHENHHNHHENHLSHHWYLGRDIRPQCLTGFISLNKTSPRYSNSWLWWRWWWPQNDDCDVVVDDHRNVDSINNSGFSGRGSTWGFIPPPLSGPRHSCPGATKTQDQIHRN